MFISKEDLLQDSSGSVSVPHDGCQHSSFTGVLPVEESNSCCQIWDPKHPNTYNLKSPWVKSKGSVWGVSLFGGGGYLLNLVYFGDTELLVLFLWEFPPLGRRG